MLKNRKLFKYTFLTAHKGSVSENGPSPLLGCVRIKRK